MVAISAWFDYVLPDAPGVTTALVEQQVREKAREFCEVTERWQGDPTPITAAGNALYVALTPPAGAEVWRVHAHKADGDPVLPATEAELDALLGNGWRRGDTGIVRRHRLSIDRTLMFLYPVPAESTPLTVTLVLRPTKTAATLPDWLFVDHEPAITHGVKAALFSMFKKPWTDGERAGYHMSEWRAALGLGDVTRMRGGTRAILKTAGAYR